MNWLFRRRWLAALALIWLFAACNGQQQEPTLVPATATPLPVAANLDNAQIVAADFLNAWMQDGYYAMYELLSINSRDVISLDDFENLYRTTDQQMRVPAGGKSYSLASIIQKGSNVQVAYDVTYQSDLFGEFGDPGRILDLVVAQEGWRVAWTPADVLAEFRNGGRLAVTQTTPNRGNIYDRDGEVIADQNGSILLVNLYTKTYPTNEPDACFAEIARIFGKRSFDTLKNLYSRFTGQDYMFEIGQISAETYQPDRAALERVCTVKYDSRPTRRYVAGGLAPHVVGYIGPIPAEQVTEYEAKGYSRDALVGISGVEAYWESTLAGRGAASLIVYDGNNKVSRVLAERPAQPSQSIYLTLDRRLQNGVQDTLRSAFESSVWGPTALGAAAVVMDVHTGEILAIASYPDYNVDAFNPYTALPNAQDLIAQWQSDPRKPTLNRATQGQFPAGSVFKIVSMMAAADSGVFGLNQRIFCGGVWNGTPLGDRTRNDWLEGGHGSVTLRQALTGSCNVYFWNVGWQLNAVDPYLLINYAKRAGLGAPTGLRDIAEAGGTLPDPATHLARYGLPWSGSDALNTVIGQGDVQVTPLQIARMVAAVANGGTLYQPMLVKAAGLIGNYSYQASPVANGELNVKPEILAAVRESMCNVTLDPTLGTARFVYLNFSGAVVCGKTGTAENPPWQTTAWFAAFAGRTQDEPEIAVVVVVERGGQGSYVAAPIVRRIVEEYFKLPVAPWPAWYGAEAASLPTPEYGE